MKERKLADRCLQPEQLEAVLRDGPDTRQQAHLEECAACRTLVASYRTFESDEPLPAGADPAAATARLDAFVDGLTGEAAEADAEPAVVGASGPRWWTRPAWRPALAAVLLVAVGGLWWWAGDEGVVKPSGVLRDGSVASDSGFAVRATAADERWALRWTPAAGADGYRVRILDAGLNEILRLDAGPAMEYTLIRADHPELAGPGPWFASIEAVKAGDLLRRTDVVELTSGAP
jgi:hypothetical protein